jgi:hypothetical protein
LTHHWIELNLRNGDFDKAALAAVRGARLLPLPSSFPAPTLVIKLSFTYDQQERK